MSGFKKTAIASSLGVLPKDEEKKDAKPSDMQTSVKVEQDKK